MKKIFLILLSIVLTLSLYSQEVNDSGEYKIDFGYGKEILIQKNNKYLKNIEIPVYGTETKLKLNVKSVDKDNINASFSGSFETTVAGYQISIKKASFDGKELTILKGKVKTTEGFSTEYIEIKNLKLKLSGVTQSSEIIEKQFFYTFDGWDAKLKNIRFTEAGLTGSCILESENEIEKTTLDNLILWCVEYKNFTVNGKGEVVTQKEDLVLENSMFYVKNHLFELNYGCFEKINNKYHLVCDSSKLIDYTVGEQIINLGKTTISSLIEIIGEKAETTSPIETTNGYIVYPETASYDGDKIHVEGILTPEEWKNCKFEKQKIIIHNNFYAEIKETIPEVEYTYAGWDIKATDVILGYDGITTQTNKVSYLNTEIELGPMDYYSTGSIIETEIYIYNQKIPIVSDDTRINETRFSSDGLYVSLEVALPFSNSTPCYATFYSVHLAQDGIISAKASPYKQNIYLDNVIFTCENTLLRNDGIYIDDFSIYIPSLQNSEIQLEGLYISNDGKVSLKGRGSAPVNLWGMVILIDDISITSDEFNIIGSVFLPNNFPGILRNRKLELNELKIGIDGIVKSIDAKVKGSFYFDALTDYRISCCSIKLDFSNNNPLVILEDATIRFPSGYEIDKVYVDNVAMEVLKETFSSEKMPLKNTHKEYIDGVDYSFTHIAIEKYKKVYLYGFANNNPKEDVRLEYRKDGSKKITKVNLTGN